MTTKCDGLPWSKNLIRANLITLVVAMIFGTYILILISWISLIIYWVFWLVFFTLGRYVSCRHCDFLGKPCPSWCMGIIGGKLFKRSQKEHIFEDKGMLKMAFFDIAPFAVAALLPIIFYIFNRFSVGLSFFDWILLIIYGIIVVVAFTLHQMGCNKCPIGQCPLSKSNKK